MTRTIFSAWRWLLLAAMATLALSTSALAQVNQEFCWKDSVPRGAGTIPSTCRGGEERVGALCYDACPAGFERNAGTVDCVQKCPAGFNNEGLFCRRAEYGRGAGYPWQWGDPLNDSAMHSRCEAANGGAGKCEAWGAVVYPKCAQGFSPAGCCICRPEVPNCTALGFAGQIDLSCTKKMVLASTPRSGNCENGDHYEHGLCYKSCPEGSNGVGPVCWLPAPSNWVDCGAGAAKDSKACASVVVGQVTSVLQTAAFLVSAGSSGGASTGAGAAAKAEKLGRMQKAFNEMKRAWEATKKAYPAVEKAVDVAQKANTARSYASQGYKYTYNAYEKVSQAKEYVYDVAPSEITEEDIVRAAADIASILDPSGISSIIGAYTYPVCSKYFKPGSGLAWADTTVNQQIPGQAVYGGIAPGGQASGVCRAMFAPGNEVPGRLSPQGSCYVAQANGVAGNVINKATFKALAVVNNSGAQWLAWSAAQAAGKKFDDLVEGGKANNQAYGVCRFNETDPNGNRQHLIGRLSGALGQPCAAAFGTVVRTATQYDVLVKSLAVPGSGVN